MVIRRISVWAVELPLSAPYFLSGGRLRFDKLDSTFVRIDTDDDCGWGEACPWGESYLPAHGRGARAAIAVLAPALLRHDAAALGDINRLMDTALPGHLYAKSALDMACWDLLGKRANLPLWKLFGGENAAPVAANSSISTAAPDDMARAIVAARAAGYRAHSAKIGGSNVALDIARMEAIDAALTPDEHITYDVNRAWTPAVAAQVLGSAAARRLRPDVWIEQPCETIEQCAQVRRRAPQPLMLDECLHSYADHLRAWRLAAGEGIKLKPNRVGGLTRALRLRDFGVEVGWQMHIEDVGGSALADTAALHLAAATPDANRLASWLCHAHLAVDPVAGQGARHGGDGLIRVPRAPGIGVAPDPDALAAPVVYEA